MNIDVIIQNYNNKKYKIFYNTENFEILFVKDFISSKVIPNILKDFDKQIKKELRKQEEKHLKEFFKKDVKDFTAQIIAIKYKGDITLTFKEVLVIEYNNIGIVLDNDTLNLYTKVTRDNKCYDLAENIEYILLISAKEEKTYKNIKLKIKTAEEKLAASIKDFNDFRNKLIIEREDDMLDENNINVEY